MSFGFSLQQFIKEFSLFIKQCYHTVGSVEKNKESKNPKVVKTKNGSIMLLSKCESVIVKNQNLLKSKNLVDY